ncbi:hypothetical protein GCM10009795_015290 [Nocardioides hankookensis]
MAADPPVHQVTITGTRVSTWPAYDADQGRFAIGATAMSPTTPDPRDGTVHVTATSTDPAARIRVDGVPLTATSTDVTGLEVGDEVNVQITDSAGTSNQSWVYLPAHFPEVDVVTDQPGQAPGYVFVGFQSFLDAQHGSLAVLDHRGVPRIVRETDGPSSDFKVSAQDPHQFTAALRVPGGGYAIQVLDDQLRVVDTYRLDGIPLDTDSHDAELLPDGRALLMGYHARAGLIDAVIQIVGPDGKADFTWSSKNHLDPAEAYIAPNGDYAHINALQMLDNGDILASFRNQSTIMRISTTYHDGFEPGDVVWRLGGPHNDFDLFGDPLGGPCAQHMPRLLPNGHLLFFDNGSRDEGPTYLGGQSADMCPTPGDPDGPRVARPVTRVVEYDLDQDAMTAAVVSSFDADPRYAPFAGDAQRLDDGNTMVGWSQAGDCTGVAAAQLCPPADPEVTASEVSADGTEVWAMRSPAWITYRAFKFEAPDRIDPEVTLEGPTDGATYAEGDVLPPVTFGCTDRGGANLDACASTVAYGAAAPSAPGPHTVSVTATDGAGNETVRSIRYTVTPTPVPPVDPPIDPPPSTPTVWQPDARIRVAGGAWKQSATVRLDTSRPGRTGALDVQVRNAGTAADRFTLRGGPASPAFTVRYVGGGRDITRGVTSGRFVTPLLRPGQTYRVRLVVTRTDRARASAQRRVSLVASSREHRSKRDGVSALVRAVR